MQHRVARRSTFAAFSLFVLLAGASLVAIRFSNRDLPPFFGAGLRLALGALVLLLLMLLTRKALPRGRALLGASLFGFFAFGLGNALAYWGLLHVQAGLGQALIGLTPLLTLFLASAQGIEPLRWSRLVGAVIAVSGIALVFNEQIAADVPLASLLAIVGSAVALSQAAVVAKRFSLGHPLASAAVGTATGAVMLLGISEVAGEAWSLPVTSTTWAALAYLVLSGTAATSVLNFYVLSRWSASRTSFQFVLLPFVTVAVGWWLLGEQLTGALAVGAFLVLLGAALGIHQGHAEGRPCAVPPRGLQGG
jgi:drug/metabolite transporter (DMT)-like permease